MSDDPQAVADRVVEQVGGRAEVLARVTHDDHGLTRFANSFIHQHIGERRTSVSLTVALDGRVASAATTRVDDGALARLVEDTLEAARVQPPDPHWPGVAPPAVVMGGGHVDPATAATTPDQRAGTVGAFVEADPNLRAAGYVDTQHVGEALATSAGQRARGGWTRATLDGIHQTATSAGSAHATSRSFDALDGAAEGALAADRARRSAAFTDVEPGHWEVVLGPEAVATIAVFLGVYGFNGKAVVEGRSFAQVGERQFDPAFGLVDDPFDPRSVSPLFDGEGTPKRRMDLVSDGVTRAVVHDRRSALRAGTASTGHGGLGAGIGPIPTSLVVAPGSTPRDDLIAGVERGLLVTEFNYCRILDPRTQVVTGLTRNGTFLIERGKVTGAVGNMRFTQSFLEALGEGAVLGVGSDDRFADSEFGAGLVIAPSLRLGSWHFTGGARG